MADNALQVIWDHLERMERKSRAFQGIAAYLLEAQRAQDRTTLRHEIRALRSMAAILQQLNQMALDISRMPGPTPFQPEHIGGPLSTPTRDAFNALPQSGNAERERRIAILASKWEFPEAPPEVVEADYRRMGYGASRR